MNVCIRILSHFRFAPSHFILPCLLLVTSVLSLPAAAQKAPLWGVDLFPADNKSQAQPRRIIARMKPTSAAQARTTLNNLNAKGLRRIKEFKLPDKARAGSQPVKGTSKSNAITVKTINFALFEVTGKQNMDQAVDDLIASGQVEYAEIDQLVHINSTTPDDPNYNLLWGLHNTGQTGGTADADIDAPEAWDIATSSNSVVVAVIDTGVDYSHPDLAANMWINPGEIASNNIDDDGNGYIDDIHGIDVVNGDSDPMDDNNHGTHVSGTIGAVGNNSSGITGVSWNTQIMALKFLDSNGRGYISDAVAALSYVVDLRVNHGVNVVLTNNSWGGSGYSQAMYDAITASSDAGMLLIAAAGNAVKNIDKIPHYPASYDHPAVISVAATNDTDTISYFSNFGSNSVDLAAPGSAIYSTTINNGYDTFSGTSMATPHAAGAAALVWAHQPGRTLLETKYLLLDTTDPVTDLTDLTRTGGRLNLFKALSCDSTAAIVIDVQNPLQNSTIAINSDVNVMVAARKCGYGETGLSVSVDPSDGAAFTLVDDGVGPDAVAGDGVYSASWQPVNPGAVSLDLQVTGVDINYQEIINLNVINNYTVNTVGIAWLDITDATAVLGNASNDFVAIPIGFDFKFYDQVYSDIFIASNGILTFDQGTTISNNQPVPYVLEPNNFIAPFWDDLRPAANAGGYVHYRTDGSAPNRRLIVQWNDIRPLGSIDSITFQAILHEGTGDILFQYLDTDTNDPVYDFGVSATVGIEYLDGTGGLEYSYNQAVITDNLALLMSTKTCDTATAPVYVYVDSVRVGRSVIPGDNVDLQLIASQCYAPKTGLTVTVDSGDGSSVTLYDDGSGSDQTAGDGIYSGSWSVINVGYTNLQFQVNGTNVNQSTSLLVNVIDLPTYSISSVPIDWVDATGGIGILSDGYHDTLAIPIGFEFSFYGVPYDEVYVDTNGTLQFNLGYSSYSNVTIPNTSNPNNFLAVYWDFLYPSGGDQIYYLLEGEAPSRRLIVQWNSLPFYLQTNPLTIQAILYEGSHEIRYQYLDTTTDDNLRDNGATATVGLENHDGSAGLLYSYNTIDSIPDNSALLIQDIACNPATAAEYTTIGSPVAGDELFIDDAVQLRYHALVCGQPVTGLSVQVNISDGSSLMLLDDGVAPDQVAGDGGYTASWLPTTTGTTTLDYQTTIDGIEFSKSINVFAIANYEITPVAYNWLDATSGTPLLTGPFYEFTSIPIGFDFEFYGASYTDINIASVGLMNFGVGSDSEFNRVIPTAEIPNNFIAPYWDALLGSTTGQVYYLNGGEAPNRYLIVQWDNIVHGYTSGTDTLTFQAILYEGSNDILFQYKDMFIDRILSNYGASSTVGVEYKTGTRGEQYSYNTVRSIGNKRALLVSNTPCNPQESFAYFYVDSPWEDDKYFVGDTMNLRLQALRCNTPLTGVTVTVDPGDGSSVVLSDDGVTPDLIAGDGIFSADWQITQSGLTILDFNVQGAGIVFNDSKTINVVPRYVKHATEFDWIDATSGTSISTTLNPNRNPVPIGFDFDFYGQTFSDLYVQINGVVMFADPINYVGNNEIIPRADGYNNLIAVLWDFIDSSKGGNIYYLTDGVAPNRRFVVQWDNVTIYYGNEPVSYQAILYEGSNNIVLQYLDAYSGNTTIDNGASATVGIEYFDNMEATLHSYNTPGSVPDGSAFAFVQMGVDTDGDGLSDNFEALIGTDPNLVDSDYDTLSDGFEVNWDGDATAYTPGQDLNPLSSDTDGDGVTDQNELLTGSNPLDSNSMPVFGDLNDDGVVDVADVLLVTRFALGLATPTLRQQVLADVAPNDGIIPMPDGEINAGDVLFINRMALGLTGF